MVLDRLYTMNEASKLLGVTVRTIQRWDKAGKIRCVRTIGGKRRVPESEIKRVLGLHEERKIVGYARVSSHTQRDHLERQRQLIVEYARGRGYGEIEVLADVGSGLNEHRKNFMKLLKMVAHREVSKVIVAHPDTRFGFHTLRELFRSHGAEIVVINEEEPQQELVEDLVTIISHFAGKLYEVRSHKYREVVEGARKLVQDP